MPPSYREKFWVKRILFKVKKIYIYILIRVLTMSDVWAIWIGKMAIWILCHVSEDRVQFNLRPHGGVGALLHCAVISAPDRRKQGRTR